MERCNFKKLTREHVKELYLITRPHPRGGLQSSPLPQKKNTLKLTLRKHRLCRRGGTDHFTWFTLNTETSWWL